IVRLAPAPIADIEQKLVSDFSIPQEAARQVAIISQGRYFHATQILQDDNHAVHDAVRELFNCIFTNKGIELVKQTEIWADLGREPIKNRLQYIIQLLHLSIKAHYFPVQSLPASPLEMQFATTMLKKGVPIARIHAMTEAINDTIHYIQRNANAKIQLLALALRLQASIHGRE
ncbi:MAG: hypothetical protein EBX41_07545, partial [Chitinophagia bacterium]|nr:hypothetical protein [Chitinophagia bacterium]